MEAPTDNDNDPSLGKSGLSTRLYSHGGILVATVLASAFGGIVLMYLNYLAMNQAPLARKFILWAVPATFLLVLVVVVLVQMAGIPVLALFIQLFVIHAVARTFQGPAFRYFESKHGNYHSYWRAAGVGILGGLILFLPFAFVLGLLLEVMGLSPAPSG